MSRCDRGRERPGIDRFRTQIGEARAVVLEHPVYRRLDTLADVSAGTPVPDVLTRATVPAPAVACVRTTGEILERAPLHRQAEALAVDQEDPIPDPVGLLGGGEHSPKARQMVADARWAERSATTDTALRTRVRFGDGVVAAVANLPRPS